MANKILILFLLKLSAIAQNLHEDLHTGEKDYKNPDHFVKFYQRRKIIGAWQIQSLKNGALVIKLKDNSIAVTALKQRGDVRMAEKKRLEARTFNLNVYRAFRRDYKFSKIYFINSDHGDSLLSGLRNNIFLDSSLVVDPSIHMTEDFYLIAEPDYIYNSAIGFVERDSARIVKETGSQSSTEPAVVIKNKYGHQLKKPFPYGYYYGFYEDFSNFVYSLNADLFRFYRKKPMPSSAELESVKPYLY